MLVRKWSPSVSFLDKIDSDFAKLWANCTQKLGNLVQAGASEPINAVFKKQEQDFEAASPQVQQLAEAYKEQVESSPEVKALTSNLSALTLQPQDMVGSFLYIAHVGDRRFKCGFSDDLDDRNGQNASKSDDLSIHWL